MGRKLQTDKEQQTYNSLEQEQVWCCQQLEVYAGFAEPIIYLPQTRSYLLKLTEELTCDLNYCPWCGAKLPKDLTNQLMDIIYNQLQLASCNDPRLPGKFKSDQWWKMANQ